MLPGLRTPLEPLKLTIIRCEDTMSRDSTPKVPAFISPLGGIFFQVVYCQWNNGMLE